MKPVIGISLNTSPPDDSKRSFSKGVELQHIQLPYIKFVEAGGGAPLLVPNLTDLSSIPEMVDRLDGLIIIGGVDVDPQLYGEENTHSKGCDLTRDKMEIALVKEARRQLKPLMGICRGLQIINTAFQGTLFQDLLQAIDGAQKHHREPEEPEIYHQILLVRRSFLNDVFEVNELNVNSSHHQSVAVVGKGLSVLAAAQDGVIEALECPDDRCTMAVQWHPERMLDDPKQVALARWFVSKAF